MRIVRAPASSAITVCPDAREWIWIGETGGIRRRILMIPGGRLVSVDRLIQECEPATSGDGGK
jgi:hypothetical protein